VLLEHLNNWDVKKKRSYAGRTPPPPPPSPPGDSRVL
jgi:hypothetical protein